MSKAGTVMPGGEEMALVRVILAAHLPPGATVLAFGSRVKGAHRPYSDLDLALDAGRPLSLDEHARLAEAFSESDLPFKVDLVDLRLASDAFRRHIEAEGLPLVQGGESDSTE